MVVNLASVVILILNGMNWFLRSLSRLPNGIRMIEVDEDTFEWDTYIRFYNMSKAIMTELHWTNGTQYICRDAKGMNDRVKVY